MRRTNWAQKNWNWSLTHRAKAPANLLILLKRKHNCPSLRTTFPKGKLWTPEIFLECFCVARKRPIRREKTEPQARTLISLWFCGYSLHVLIFAVIGQHNKHSWDISSFCSFCTVTGKQSLSLSFQDIWGIWGLSEVSLVKTCVMCKGLTVYLLLK